MPITTTCPRCSALVGGAPDPATGNLLCAACGSQFDPRQAATTAGSAAPAAAWQPATGDELTGGYILESELGRGGMATVWQARQSSLSRRVAIKILHAHLSGDIDFRRRFLREAEAMVQLDHPNIVPVLDRGEYRQRQFLVTAQVGPRTLRDEMNDGCLTPKRVADVARQILAGLQHAHSRGLIHRDIKPENLLLSAEGSVHIADFGIAQVARSIDGHTLTQLTGTNVIMGTVAYMAPEQSQARSFIDHRCDLYSLGVVCYEALVGHRPVGRFEDPSSLLKLSKKDCVAWDKFIFGLLERDPEKRIADAKSALSLIPADKNNNDVFISDMDDAFAEVREELHQAGDEIKQAFLEVRAEFRGGEKSPRTNESHVSSDKNEAAAQVSEAFPHGRALLRAQEDRWMGGLCGGLAHWLGIRTGWVRLGVLIAPLITFPGFEIGFIGITLLYIAGVLIVPLCPDKEYRPKPLNYGWMMRDGGWLFGVCDALGRESIIPAWLWRIIALVTLPLGSIIPYLMLGIFLPSRARTNAETYATYESAQTADHIRKCQDEKEQRQDPIPAPPKNKIIHWQFALVGVAIGIFALLFHAKQFYVAELALWPIAGFAIMAALFHTQQTSFRFPGGSFGSILFSLGIVLALLLAGPRSSALNFKRVTTMSLASPLSGTAVIERHSNDPFVVSATDSEDNLTVELDTSAIPANQYALPTSRDKRFINSMAIISLVLASLVTFIAVLFRRYDSVLFASAQFIAVGSVAMMSQFIFGYPASTVSFLVFVMVFYSVTFGLSALSYKLLRPLAVADPRFQLAPTLVGIATTAGIGICAMPLLSGGTSITFPQAIALPTWIGIASLGGGALIVLSMRYFIARVLLTVLLLCAFAAAFLRYM